MKHLKNINEYLLMNENISTKIKLVDIFDEYPDRDELIWEFVNDDEFENEEFDVTTLPIDKLIDDEFIENFNDNAEPWQRKYVKSLIKDVDKVKDKPIVVSKHDSGYIIIDGNHKLMAMYKSGVKNVNVVEL